MNGKKKPDNRTKFLDTRGSVIAREKNVIRTHTNSQRHIVFRKEKFSFSLRISFIGDVTHLYDKTRRLYKTHNVCNFLPR